MDFFVLSVVAVTFLVMFCSCMSMIYMCEKLSVQLKDVQKKVNMLQTLRLEHDLGYDIRRTTDILPLPAYKSYHVLGLEVWREDVQK